MEFTGAQLQYLDHLGIDVWVPREQLLQQASVPSQVDQVSTAVNDVISAAAQTGAAHHQTASDANPAQIAELNQVPVSNPGKEPQVQTAQISVPAPAASSSGITTNVDNIKAATGITPAFPMAAAPAYPGGDLKAAQPSSAPNQVSEIPEFNLQFWCYGSGLWLVNGHVDIQPEHHKLVHNIAQFIQGKKTKPRHVGIFSWPMLDAPNIDQGPEVAAKHLKDYIHRLQEISTVKKLVVFADDGDRFSYLSPINIDYTLDDLLNNSEHKKALWQILMPHQLAD